MNRRALILLSFAFAIFVGSVLAWLYWKKAEQSSPIRMPAAEAIASPMPNSTKPVTEPRLFRAKGYPPTTPEAKAMWDWYEYISKVDHDWEWHRPIAFYGKVIDQNNHPVANAKVWMQWSADGSTPERTMLSGDDGKFQISGIQGKGISVRVEKKGYRSIAESDGSFEYAAFWEDDFHVPDPDKPVNFRLWKRGDEEPMYLWDLAKDVKTDGSESWFNVQTGKFGPSGDIVFIVTRANQNGNGKFDYKLTVKAAAGGGIAFTKEKNMFEAPLDGYLPSWETEKKFGTPDYDHVQTLRFYLKTAAGTYAAVEGDVVQMNDPEAQVQMNIFFNPSRSRNLEYNSEKRINP